MQNNLPALRDVSPALHAKCSQRSSHPHVQLRRYYNLLKLLHPPPARGDRKDIVEVYPLAKVIAEVIPCEFRVLLISELHELEHYRPVVLGC